MFIPLSLACQGCFAPPLRGRRNKSNNNIKFFISQFRIIYGVVSNMKHISLVKVIKISIACFLLSLLFIAIGICIGNIIGLVVIIAGFIVLVGAIIFIARFYRCPYCGNFLTVWYSRRYCPHCRSRLF